MAAHAGHSLHNNSAISVKLSKLIGRKEVTQDNRNVSFETNHDFNDLKIKIGSTISAYDEKKLISVTTKSPSFRIPCEV